MKKVVTNIADGDFGIDETIAKMWDLILRDAKNAKLKSIAKSLIANNDTATAKNIFDYVRKNFLYRSDPPGIEHFTAPIHLIEKRFSKYLDCDDLVGILTALALAAGIPARIKTIAWRRYEFTHVIAEFLLNGFWLPIDAVRSDGFGNTHKKIIRTKIYDNPMGTLITLEDGPCCTGSRRRRNSDNQNIIMIGNSAYDMANLNAGKQPPQYIEKPYPVYKTVEKKIPVPVEKIKTVYLKTPIRRFDNGNITNYKEFY